MEEGICMSDRERLLQLLDYVPDNKIPYVIGFIQGLLIVDMPEVANSCIDKRKVLHKSEE